MKKFILVTLQGQNLNQKCKNIQDVTLPEPRWDEHIVNTKFEAFSVFITEGIISQIVERTNEQMNKVYKKLIKMIFLPTTEAQRRNKTSFRIVVFLGTWHKAANKRAMVWYFFCNEYLQGCHFFTHIRGADEDNYVSWR